MLGRLEIGKPIIKKTLLISMRKDAVDRVIERAENLRLLIEGLDKDVVQKSSERIQS